MPDILQLTEEIYKSFESMKWINVLNIYDNQPYTAFNDNVIVDQSLSCV